MNRLFRPFTISLRMRIGVLLFAGVLGTGAGLHVLLVNLTRQRLLRELQSRTQGYTALLATRLSTPLLLQDHDQMREELKRAFQEPGVIGIVVYDQRGSEFERLVRNPDRWVPELSLGADAPHASEAQVREDGLLGKAHAIEAEAPIARDALHGTKPVIEARELYGLELPHEADSRLGSVRALYATDPVDEAVADAGRMGLTALAAALALWLLPLFALLRFIAEPLREASDLARAIATGELERRIPVRSPDELGTLAASLNTMAAALTDSREQTRTESRSLRRDGLRRALLVPLAETPGGRGAILMFSRQPDAFPPAQVEVVVGLASHLGAAVHAATLHARLESAVAELEKTRERLEHSERLRMAGEMASGVAHDFNNVLGAILGRAQLVRRRAESGELSPRELLAALQVIERAAADGGDTVRRLRQFGPGGRALDTEIVDLDEAIRGAAEFTRTRWEDEAQAEGRPVRMEIDSRPGATVEGRGSEMREIFTNMILNAIDAVPHGGTIRLSTKIESDRVVATVADDGVGMAPEVQKRMFDPFFTTKGERGTGLGLSVVYGIVQNAGGTISVQSRPAGGTTLRVELPHARGVEVPPLPLPAPESSRDTALRVMVVDDEPAVRELLADILTSLGHESQSFESGGAALEHFQPGRYDLLFTDLGMPGMTGWELSRAVRARDTDVTIAIITGWGAEISFDSVKEAGADAKISKPFTIEDIEGLVRLARERREKKAA